VGSLSIANVSYVVEADEGINYERELSTLCGDSSRPDQFEYDTTINLVPHTPSSEFSCSETEMDQIAAQLTIAQQGVLSLGDPRLSSVIEVLGNVRVREPRLVKKTTSIQIHGFRLWFCLEWIRKMPILSNIKQRCRP